ncbi:MAG: glycosyltransferase family 4 protein [Tissierella sp.]|uniref:glycosyltransferase family 4 protein n=1 Tax=Tissierella sp. TaxID=41274 RepID=UPI003F9D65E5
MSYNGDVLFLCQFFYPEYISSATLPYDTAKALVESGFEVNVLCGYPEEYNNTGKVPTEEIHEGIKIKRIKYLQLKRSNIIGRLINYFSFVFFVSLRFLSLRKYKSIIVYSNPPVLPFIAAMAKKFFGTKVIFVSYDVYPEIAIKTNVISNRSVISKLMRCVNKTVYKNANKVVALSSEMKNYLLRYRRGLDENKLAIIPNWYEDKKVLKNSSSHENKIFKNLNAKNKLVISYFGNMGIAQDLNTIINAMKILKNDTDIVFLFAGHGNKMDLMKNTIKRENIKNVFFYNFLHGEDFQDALNISDCFLVSLAEGLTGLAVPSKTYSYMMAGKPVIAIMGKDSDIARDLIENNAGYSVEVGNVNKLIKSINDLKMNEDKRKLMGKNIREIFQKKYKKEKCTQKYVDLIKNILEA